MQSKADLGAEEASLQSTAKIKVMFFCLAIWCICFMIVTYNPAFMDRMHAAVMYNCICGHCDANRNRMPDIFTEAC